MLVPFPKHSLFERRWEVDRRWHPCGLPAPNGMSSMTPGSAAPSSTYRLQISEQFTLHDAVPVVEYLARLGVGALYLSPLLRSSRGSTHGYDVVDHSHGGPGARGKGRTGGTG